MKADEKVSYEELDGSKEFEKFSNFEFLEAKVDVLQEKVELISEILEQNGLVLTTKTKVSADDVDEKTFEKLSED